MSIPLEKPTNVRYGVLGFTCVLSMITYLDRVCFGTVAPYIQTEFGLTESEKGWMFTAFAFAYAVFEVPTGWLGDRFGARNTLIRIVLWWSIFTVLTGSIYPTHPAWIAFALMLSVRFLFGMGEAGAYPNIARALHNWFPFGERGFAKGAIWMAGRFAGGITAFIVYALMYESISPDGERVEHWRHVFYIFGALGVVWCVWWWWWYRDNPAEKAGVNQAEIDLIRGESPSALKSELAHAVRAGDPRLAPDVVGVSAGEPPFAPPTAAPHAPEPLKVPWRTLFSSANLWILCVMYFCAAYGWYLNITYLPSYLKEQLAIEPGDQKWTRQFWVAGLMAGLPLLIGSVSCLLGGYLTDTFIRRTGNRKWGRRLFGVIGHGLCASCFFVAIFFMKSPWTFVLLIAFAAFWNDLTMGSSWASCLDIGRRYSGIVAGCMNTIGNLGGAIAGILTGKILDWNTGVLERGTEAYEAAKEVGWIINISLFGGAYVLAVFCWLFFDATKPVVPEEGDEH